MIAEHRIKTLTLGREGHEDVFVRLMDYEELERENIELKKRLKKYETEDLKGYGKEKRG